MISIYRFSYVAFCYDLFNHHCAKLRFRILIITVLLLLLFHCPAVPKNIAVVPFQNLTQDETKNWVGAGFSETLTTKLSEVPDFTLYERSQLNEIVKELKLQISGFVDEKTAVNIGKMHGVEILVLGSYQLMENMLRVSARFVNVESGKVLKTAEATGKLSDIFQLQDTIAFSFLSHFNVTLGEKERQKLQSAPTNDLSAYEWFSKGYEAQTVLQDFNKAIEFYTKAIELDKKYATAYNNRGSAYDEIKQYENALKDLTLALEMEPESATTLNNLGLAYNNSGLFDKAVDMYTKSIAIRPRDAVTFTNRGSAYSEKGIFDKALEDLNKAVELNPKLAEAYAHRAGVYEQMEKLNDAVADYTKAIEIRKNYPEAYANRAVLYAKLEKFDEALADCNEALKLNPDYPEALLTRGGVYLSKDMPEKAKADWEKSAGLGFEEAKKALKEVFGP